MVTTYFGLKGTRVQSVCEPLVLLSLAPAVHGYQQRRTDEGGPGGVREPLPLPLSPPSGPFQGKLPTKPQPLARNKVTLLLSPC